MDVGQVLSLLDAEDSDSVRSFSSECLELLEPLEEQEESEDEDVPKSKVFATLLKMATIFFLENYASYNCMYACTTVRYME